MLLRLVVSVSTLITTRPARAGRDRPPGDRGQSTAEYALVLLGAATVALLLVAWAGRTDTIGRLLDGVIESIISQVT